MAFLQQLGRGLRLHTGMMALTVLDLVGNHRRTRARLELLGVSSDDVAGTPQTRPTRGNGTPAARST